MVGVALGIVYVVWGSTYLAIRIMVEQMPPLVSAGLRFLAAGGVVVGFGGVAVLITASGLDGEFPVWALGVIVLAGSSWAFGSWWQPRLRLPRDPFVVAVYEMLVGGGVNPLVAVLLGWLILAEPVTVPTVAGGSVIVLSVAAIVTTELNPEARRR